jgi:hypothetical protein
MARTLFTLVLGIVVGIGAAWLLLHRPFATASIELGSLSTTDSSPPGTAPAPDDAFYGQLAEANAYELGVMITRAAGEAPSADREVILAVLFKRLSEIDVSAASRLARATRPSGTALATVYGALARTDPAAALAALRTAEGPDDAAAIGLALIQALGDDVAAFERVAAEFLPLEPEATGFGPPPTAPFNAFFRPRSALGLTAERWADGAPERALAMVREVTDERLRRVLEAAALRAVARVAPDLAFEHLASRDADLQQLGVFGGALYELARTEPERLLATTRGWSPDARRAVEMAAMQQLAEQDPLAAMRHLDGLPPGAERQSIAQIVARSYGRRDAAAALAWARSQPDRQNLLASVIGGVAQRDPGRALDLALELEAPLERARAVQVVAWNGAGRDDTAETLANRVLALDDPSLRDSFAFSFMSMWSSRSPDNAMRWLLANGAQLTPNLFQSVGQQLATGDAQKAADYTEQVPVGAREPWIHGVAQGYAQHDPQGAIEWLTRYRSEQWYDRAATTLAMTIAQRDGAAAARLIDDVDTSAAGVPVQQLVTMVATNWANHDPAAAVEWAGDRRSEQERTLAVRSVIGVWSNQDLDAARNWTLGQPPSATRDGALTMVLLIAATARSSNTLDAALLNAFTSETARQQAVLQAVQSLAYGDPRKAQILADTYIRDPALHSQAESLLDAARSNAARPQVTFGTSDSLQSAFPLLVR